MGKSSSVTVGHKVLLGGHVVFCHGPIDSIDTIEWDGRAGWRGLATGGTITVDAENLFGGSKEASTTPGFGGGDNSDADGVSGEIDILMGEPTQLQNSYLQSVLGELIPAFRGVVSFVLKQLYVGNSPSLRPLAAWGTRIHVKDDGQPQWYDEKAAIFKTVSSEFPKYLNINAYNSAPEFNGVDLMFGGLEVTGAKATDVLRVTKLTVADGGTYQAWSPWNTDVGHPNPWTNRFYIGVPDGLGDYIFTGYFAGLYSTQAAAEAAVSGEDIILTGYTSYKVGLFDTPWNDNRGGLSFKVELLNQQNDINPAHFIRECYTSTVWGLKRPEYEMNDDSFTAAADQLFDEGMGISLLWDRQQPINDLIEEIKRHINADIYIDNEGLVTLKLIRDDYVYDDLPVYDDSNIIRIERIASTPERELINAVTVVYWDSKTGKDASVQIPHAALVQMTGRINPTTVRYDFFTNADIAIKKGEYDLRVITSSLQTYQVVTNRSSEELNIGDRFILNRPALGAHNMVVRIIDADLGNGVNNEISLTVTQEVFSLPSLPVMATSPDAVWQNPVQPAVPAPARLVFEQPFYELVQYKGQTEVDAMLAADNTLAMLGVAAIRPPIISLDAQVIVDDGAGYHEASVLDYCPSALLATAMNYTTKNITFTDEIDLDLVSTGTHCQIGDELLVVEALNLTARTATLGRGVLDTVPAKEHLVGARIWFWDYYSASDSVAYSDGETVDVKVLTDSSLGRLATSAAPVDSIEFVGRAARPYPPGQLLINGDEYPATIGATDGLSLAWAHRDRLLQTAGTLQDTTVGDIGPEPGTTYTLRIYNQFMTLLRTVSAIAGKVYDYTTTMEAVDSGAGSSGVEEPFWKDTTLLLNFNSTNASTVFLDVSSKLATVSGDAKLSTAQFKYGSSALVFDGTGDYIEIPYSNAMDVGSGNFVIEFWFRTNDIAAPHVLFDWRSATSAIGIVISQPSGNTNKIRFAAGDSNTAAFEVDILSSGTIAANTWYHLAAVKNGTAWALYIGGASQGTATVTLTPYINSANIRLGTDRSGSNAYNGYIDDFRLTKAARYPTGFTQPSQQMAHRIKDVNFADNKLLLIFEDDDYSKTILDCSTLALPVSFFGTARLSTAQSKYGTSSLALDRTVSYADFISLAFNSNHTGLSDITVDAWIRSSETVSTWYHTIAARGVPPSSSREGWTLAIEPDGKLALRCFNTGSATVYIKGSTVLSVNTWYHVAFCKSGTSWYLFLNGSSEGTATETGVIGVGGQDLCIGRDQFLGSSGDWYGYIDEFRIRSGAHYTSAFTPPATSLYPEDSFWANTPILMNFEGANNSMFIENTGNVSVLGTAVGNAQISTTQSKFGGSAGYFDGVGDYVTFPDSQAYYLNGDFTVECWLYGNLTGGDYVPILSQNASLSSNNNRSMFFYSSSSDSTPNAWTFYDYTTGTNVLVAVSDTPPVNTWFHFAVSKQGSSYKFFRNGVQIGGTQTSAASIQDVAGDLYIGVARLLGVSKYFNGYIDDLRITKAARYTADFTPPSRELGRYLPALNDQLTFELESERDGLASYQKHNVTVVRA